ncbi:TetR/AcrR family transcriptional regulator [Gordonia humi]|nr:TetR/AcrR family transcriptional regulator [Gordonia humi]
MSNSTPITRRSSYGPTSATVGKRGAHTRMRIVDVSLDLFDRHGYFNTSVDAIAKEADISRATLYQYFPGKDEIFLELLDVCGRAMYRVARRIGPLGPTRIGFDNLNWWLGEWSWVFDKYSTMFVQWATVANTEATVRSQVESFVDGYVHMLTRRLDEAELQGLDARSAAAILVAVVHRVNLFLATDRTFGRGVDEVVDGMSVVLQLMLFPQTPASVFDDVLGSKGDSSPIAVPTLPSIEGLSADERTADLSKRATRTVYALIEAGADQFRQKGYYRANVDDIVEAAGLARGTFYKYFKEKQDLLVAVSIEAVRESEQIVEQLRTVDTVDLDAEALRAWIRATVSFIDKYSGSINAWIERTADDDLVTRLGAHWLAVFDIAIVDTLVARDLKYPIDPVISAVVLRCLVSRLPETARELDPPLSESEIIDLLAETIERGFFNKTFLLASDDHTQ